jgi:hypothetical protein
MMTSIQYSFKALASGAMLSQRNATASAFDREASQEARLLLKLRDFAENRAPLATNKPLSSSSGRDMNDSVKVTEDKQRHVQYDKSAVYESLKLAPEDLVNRGLSGIVNLKNIVFRNSFHFDKASKLKKVGSSV